MPPPKQDHFQGLEKKIIRMEMYEHGYKLNCEEHGSKLSRKEHGSKLNCEENANISKPVAGGWWSTGISRFVGEVHTARPRRLCHLSKENSTRVIILTPTRVSSMYIQLYSLGNAIASGNVYNACGKTHE
mmetsp:Transcript_20584/g.38706  ORF Transcript_20584/g.38706 Transcript_20584/m.38706 type:complete len:130 (-) Transcript_20584:230-619(-)